MRTFARVVLFGLFLGSFVAPAKADTIYSYVGDTFSFVQGVYAPGDRITGSFVLSDSHPLYLGNLGGAYDVTSSIVSFSFTDGHQTLNQVNSTGTFHVPISGFDGTPILPFRGGNTGWEVDIRTATSGILTVSTIDYEMFAWMGGAQPSAFHPCSGVNSDSSGPLCFDDPTISTAVIFGLDNRAPGFPGTWTMQSVPAQSLPEGGTTLLFLFIGLIGLAIQTRFSFSRRVRRAL